MIARGDEWKALFGHQPGDLALGLFLPALLCLAAVAEAVINSLGLLRKGKSG